MGNYIWNGERLLDRQEAAVDPEDRGYNFGDGIYEVFRVYNGVVFEADAHWERFARSAKEIGIELPYTIDQMNKGIDALIQADGLSDGIVYLQVTRGTAPRSHAFPSAGTPPVFTGFTKPAQRPKANLDDGVSAVTQPDIRWLRCDIKSLNLLPNVLAKQAASEAGAAEAILHRNGTVTEGSSSNIAIVKEGVLRTHQADNLILNGITRKVVLRLADKLEIPVAEEAFTLDDLRDADEVFLMSTTSEVMPIVRIDGRPVRDGMPGPVTRKLQAAYEGLL